MKRLLDLSVALLALPMWLPAMAAVALAVRVAMGSPVLYASERAGLGGRAFRFLKFRTMREGPGTDAERLTGFGRWLRARSLDELPQLWHVIRGEMSLVGPRPLPTRYLPRYSAEQARRHEVRPGITGLAQVKGRNAISWEERLRLDVEYADRHSLRMDLGILLRTPAVVFSRRGIAHGDEATMSEFRGPCGEAGK